MAGSTLRKSVPLGQAELEALAKLQDTSSPERDALQRLVGISPSERLSEAEGLPAIIRAGIARIEEQTVSDGYAAMAAEMSDEDRAYIRAARRRSMDIGARD